MSPACQLLLQFHDMVTVVVGAEPVEIITWIVLAPLATDTSVVLFHLIIYNASGKRCFVNNAECLSIYGIYDNEMLYGGIYSLSSMPHPTVCTCNHLVMHAYGRAS